MNKLFAFGEKTARRRTDVREKNIERSTLKALQQRESFQWLAGDTSEIWAGQNEFQCSQQCVSYFSARPRTWMKPNPSPRSAREPTHCPGDATQWRHETPGRRGVNRSELGLVGRKLCVKKRRPFLARRQCVARAGKLRIAAHRLGPCYVPCLADCSSMQSECSPCRNSKIYVCSSSNRK